MYYSLIKRHINRLDENMVFNFFKNKGIILSNDESIFLCNLAKERWEELYRKDYYSTYSDIKKALGDERAKKILDIYFSTINQYLS